MHLMNKCNFLTLKRNGQWYVFQIIKSPQELYLCNTIIQCKLQLQHLHRMQNEYEVECKYQISSFVPKLNLNCGSLF